MSYEPRSSSESLIFADKKSSFLLPASSESIIYK